MGSRKARPSLQGEFAAQERVLAETRAAGAALEASLAEERARLASMTEARDLAETTIRGLEMQRDGLNARLAEEINRSEVRRIALDEMRLRAERAEHLAESEQHRGASLRAELQARQIELREAERRIANLVSDAEIARIRRGEALPEPAIDPTAEPAGANVVELRPKAGPAARG